MKDGIHAIIQKINIEAEKNSSEYYEYRKNRSDEELNAENAAYLDDLGKRCDMLKKNNEREYTRMLERIISRMNLDILTYQHNLINEIFNMAVSKLKDISEKEFSNMFKSTVKNLTGSFTLYLGEFSAGKLDRAEIEEAIKERGNINIILSDETVPKKSGFVLIDDRVEYSCLFEDLIEDIKNERSASLLKEIFGEIENRLVL